MRGWGLLHSTNHCWTTTHGKNTSPDGNTHTSVDDDLVERVERFGGLVVPDYPRREAHPKGDLHASAHDAPHLLPHCLVLERAEETHRPQVEAEVWGHRSLRPPAPASPPTEAARTTKRRTRTNDAQPLAESASALRRLHLISTFVCVVQPATEP